MSASKTARAAENAVAKSNRKEVVELTPEQVIANIRKDATQGAFVQTANWKILLAEYDKLAGLFDKYKTSAEIFSNAVTALTAEATELKASVARLTEQNEQLLKVYAAENQPNTTVSFFEPPATVDAETQESRSTLNDVTTVGE